MHNIDRIIELDAEITRITHDIIAIGVFIGLLFVASVVCFSYGYIQKNKDKIFIGCLLACLVVGFAIGEGYQVYDKEMLEYEKQQLIDSIEVSDLPL